MTRGDVGTRSFFVRHVWWIAAFVVAVWVFFYIDDKAVLQDNQYRLTLAIVFAPVLATALGVYLWKPVNKLPWILYGMSWLMGAIGDTIIQFWGVIGEPPPTVSDVFWLQQAPYLALAMVLFIWQRSKVRSLTLGVSAAIVAISIASITYVPTFEFVVGNPDLTTGYSWVLVGYTLGSIALLYTAVRLGFSHGQLSLAYLAILAIVGIQAFTSIANAQLSFLWANASDPTVTASFNWLTLIPRMSLYVLGTIIPLHWSMKAIGVSVGKDPDVITPHREALLVGVIMLPLVGTLIEPGSSPSVVLAGMLVVGLLAWRYILVVRATTEKADIAIQRAQEVLQQVQTSGVK